MWAAVAGALFRLPFGVYSHTLDQMSYPTMPTLPQLTRQDARQLAIIKQHLADDEPPALLTLITDLGCVQLDPISAVAPSHRLVLWSRTGHNPDPALEPLRWETRDLFEYWAHAASLVATADYPVHAWNMRQARENDENWQAWAAARNLDGMTDYVLAQLHERGPLLSREIEDPSERYDHRWWSGRHVPRVLQHLWTCGEVMVVGREGRQRRWGLTAGFLPASVLAAPAWTDAQVTRYAVGVAVRALGVATPQQIKAHYTRHRYPALAQALRDLLAEGVLVRVAVTENGAPLKGDWYMHADDAPLLAEIQRGARRPTRTVLLSPFDNLICDRDRTALLFGFHYRIEIYVPAEKREYGYYVLPLLHEDRLIGRIHPKYDAETGTLHVYDVYCEPGAPRNRRLLRQIRQEVERLGALVGARQVVWGNVPEGWAGVRG